MATETAKEQLERCEKRTEQHPDSATAHYNLGLALTRRGRADSAEKAYRKALELDPDLVEAWVNLGGTLLMKWDFKGALAATEEALERKDDLLVVHYNLGQAHLYLGQAEEVVRCNRRVIELDPDHPAGHYFLAVGLLATQHLDEARLELARAMELGHRPQPEFLRALERVEKDTANEGPNVMEIGADAPQDPKEK